MKNNTQRTTASGGRRKSSSPVLETIIVVVATVVTIYSVEVGLLLREHWVITNEPELATVPPNHRARWLAIRKAAEQAGAPFDERSEVEMFSDLGAVGIDAWWPSYGPAFIARHLTIDIDDVEVLPLGGISQAPVLFCNRDGGYLIYENDEHGFRNPRGLYDSDSVQVTIVGDSFAAGMCVGDEDHTAALVREAYRGTLTFGVAGFGPLAILGTLVEYVTPLAPPKVLWFFFEGNDHSDLEREINHQLLPRYLEEDFSQELRGLQNPLDRAMRSFGKEEKGRLRLRQQAILNRRSWKGVIKLQNLRLALAPLLVTDRAEQALFRRGVLRQILQRANDRVTNWGGTMYFVYLPAFERYVNSRSPPRHRESVLRLVDELGIPVIDLHPEFQAHPDPTDLFPFGMGVHYNEEGYRIVAETILEVLSLDQEQFDATP